MAENYKEKPKFLGNEFKIDAVPPTFFTYLGLSASSVKDVRGVIPKDPGRLDIRVTFTDGSEKFYHYLNDQLYPKVPKKLDK